MKVARYNEKDARDIEEVAAKLGFSKAILKRRFMNEMSHITSNPRELVLSFLLMMERLFVKSEADLLAANLKKDRLWREHTR